MLKEVYEIDEFGFVIDAHVAEVDDLNNILDYTKIKMIPVGYQGLNKPRWNGSEWTEGESEEEKELREYDNYIQSLVPSQQAIQKAQLEIEVLNIINELGVI